MGGGGTWSAQPREEMMADLYLEGGFVGPGGGLFPIHCSVTRRQAALQVQYTRLSAECLGFQFHAPLTAILRLNITICMRNNSCVADVALRLMAILPLMALPKGVYTVHPLASAFRSLSICAMYLLTCLLAAGSLSRGRRNKTLPLLRRGGPHPQPHPSELAFRQPQRWPQVVRGGSAGTHHPRAATQYCAGTPRRVTVCFEMP